MGRDALIVVGINHHTAPVAVRERLGFRPDELAPALTRLTGTEGVREAVIVSTCNRVEVVASVDEAAAAPADTITSVLAADRNVPPADLAPHVFAHTGRDALRHLFRVTASLDSMVVGEPQILGQVKEHYEEATQAGTSGAVLHKMFHRAFAVAKRVRTETGIAGKAVSVASAAVDMARTIFERFDDKTAMLIGAGDMSELAARHLRGQGISGI